MMRVPSIVALVIIFLHDDVSGYAGKEDTKVRGKKGPNAFRKYNLAYSSPSAYRNHANSVNVKSPTYLPNKTSDKKRHGNGKKGEKYESKQHGGSLYWKKGKKKQKKAMIPQHQVPHKKLWHSNHPYESHNKNNWFPASAPSPIPFSAAAKLKSTSDADEGMPMLPSMGSAQENPRSVPVGTSTCFTDFHSINVLEVDVDATQTRSYVICPNSIIETEDYFFLALRPNMDVRCGEDGKSSNNCLITNGILGVGGNMVYFEFEYLTNVHISGFTFDGLTENGSFITLPGEITISDCVFKNMANLGPAYGAWFPDDSGLDMNENVKLSSLDASSLKSGERKLLQEVNRVLREPTIDDILYLTYENCVFEGNSGIKLPDDGTLPGMVVSQGQTVTKIKDCLFADNSYVAIGDFTYGALVIVEDGEVVLDNNCFMNNEIVAPAPILVVYGAAVSSGNFLDAAQQSTCELVAIYDTLEGGFLDAPMATCIESDRETCGIEE